MGIFLTELSCCQRTTFKRWFVRPMFVCFFLFLFFGKVTAQQPQHARRAISETEREQILLRYFHPIEILGRTRTDSLLIASSEIEDSPTGSVWTAARRPDNEIVIEARHLISVGNLGEAQSILETAFKKGDPHPEVPFLLAQILVAEGSPGGRQKAEELINEALRRAPGNIEYRLARARIYDMRTLEGYAERELDRVLRDVPSLAEAFAIKGQFKVERLTGAGWRKSGWGAEIKRPWIESERKLALEHLATAVALDSLNTRAHHWLAHLYLHEENWESAMRVLNRMVGLGIEPDLAKLGRGIALFNLQLFADTKIAFDSAYGLLEPGIKELMYATAWVKPITPPSGYSQDAVIDPKTAVTASVDTVFWTGHDLLLSDDINHRALEQARRFAYVAWFFKLPALNLAGWETLAGQIYLRYGEPRGRRDIRISQFHRMRGFNIELPGIEANRPGGTYPRARVDMGQFYRMPPPFPSQWWHYGDFGIPLGIGFITGNLDFITQNPPGPGAERLFEFIDNAQLYAEFTNRLPDLSNIAGIVTPVALASRFYKFPSGEKETEIVGVMKTDSDLALDLIRGKRGFQQEPFLHAIALELKSGKQIRANAPIFQANRFWSTLPYYSRQYLLVAPPVSLSSGEYLLSFELTAGEGPSWTSKDSVTVIESESELRISDIVLASVVEQEPTRKGWPSAGTMNRNGWRIVPRFSDTFRAREPKILYVEFAGLNKDEYGSTNYAIDLSIGRSRRRGLVAFTAELFEGITGRRSGQEQITISWERSGITTHGAEVLNIVIPEPDEDEYVFTLRITDQVAGRAAEIRTILIVSDKR